MCKKKKLRTQFDRDVDDSLKLLSHSRDRCAWVAETFTGIEEDLDEGLRVIRNHFQETASASLALTCGKIEVAETYASIEEDLNDGLRVIRNHFQETASATLALTCGKSDRGHNEVI